MVLSRDFITSSGLLMLTAGHVFDDAVIRKVIGFEKSIGTRLKADVWRENPGAIPLISASTAPAYASQPTP